MIRRIQQTLAGEDSVGRRHFRECDFERSERQGGIGLELLPDADPVGGVDDVGQAHHLAEADGRHVEGILEGPPQRDDAAELFIVVSGRVGLFAGIDDD